MLSEAILGTSFRGEACATGCVVSGWIKCGVHCLMGWDERCNTPHTTLNLRGRLQHVTRCENEGVVRAVTVVASPSTADSDLQSRVVTVVHRYGSQAARTVPSTVGEARAVGL